MHQINQCYMRKVPKKCGDACMKFYYLNLCVVLLNFFVVLSYVALMLYNLDVLMIWNHKIERYLEKLHQSHNIQQSVAFILLSVRSLLISHYSRRFDNIISVGVISYVSTNC